VNHNRIPDYGPNVPLETGVRWTRYHRGFRLDGTTLNRLYSGPPVLNPFTNRPYKGAIIAASRGTMTTNVRVGAVIQISVADPSGAFDFRECVIGPGSPVALALGQYGTVNIEVVNRSVADGVVMNSPATIQWVDSLPSLPDAGLLRARIMLLTEGVGVPFTPVPDGAVECEVLGVGAAPGPFTIAFDDFSSSAGAAGTRSTRIVNVGDTFRVQGQAVGLTAPALAQCSLRFYLAGL
jgi:hypothetical protein